MIFTDWLKLFMYIRSNNGPKMELYSMPYLIVWISDLLLLMVLYWVLSLR